MLVLWAVLGAAESSSASMAVVGTTIRRPRRSDGITPRRTHSYALEREMPSTVAAWVTVMVAGLCLVFIVLLRRSGERVRDASEAGGVATTIGVFGRKSAHATRSLDVGIGRCACSF